MIYGGAFRPPQIVKVGALSAPPTQDMLLKYSLDLPYIQTEVIIPPLLFSLHLFFLIAI